MDRRGFTFIELVMVIVLIGIIAVYAGPRLSNVTDTKAGAFVDKLRADIRYAQNLAMTRNQQYRVYFNGGGGGAPASGYSVVNNATGVTALDPAGGGNLIVTLNSGDYAGITVSTPSGGYIEFNALGAPTAAATLTISPGGQQVTITAKTGAVN
jgi:MSHA pilin protein MshC